MTKDQPAAKKLILRGDFSIAGVSEQMPFLLEHLTGETSAMPKGIDLKLPYTLDLSGVECLDACGCQLLAIVIRALRKQGVEELSSNMNEYCRQQIELLGFAEEIFAGECA